jgi:hypothetical protein
MMTLLALQQLWGDGVLALTPSERFRAVQNGPSPWNGWQWGLLVFGGAAIIATVAAISHVRKKRRQLQADWDAFYREANARGLDEQEVDLLKVIARRSGVMHPDAIFGMEAAFYHGSQEFRHSDSYERMSTNERTSVDRHLAALRSKLAATDDQHARGEAATNDSRSIRPGTRLSLLHRSAREGCSATVTQSDSRHLGVKPDMPMRLAPGEECRVRYFDGRTVWEFDTSIGAVGLDEGELLLNHSDQLRFIDRRRFHRVPVQRRALLAQYNFNRETEALRSPDFEESLVVEMAGPGLKIRTPMDLRKGDHVLVLVQYRKDRSFQGSARVVRVDGANRMIKSVALEMQGLTPKQIAQMTTVTNAAAIQQRKDETRANEDTQDETDTAAAAVTGSEDDLATTA